MIPTSWRDLDDKGVQWETFAAGRNALIEGGSRRQSRIAEGDGVFILGFPVGWIPGTGRQDYPIVRQGVFDANPRMELNSDHDTFLVDGSGFPGNSGGPVVTKPQFVGVLGTKNVTAPFLVGMVSQRRFSRLTTLSPRTSGTEDLEFHTQSLIEVVPMGLD